MMLILWYIRDEDPIERKGMTALASILPPAQAMSELRKPISAAGGDRVDWKAKISNRRKMPFAIKMSYRA